MVQIDLFKIRSMSILIADFTPFNANPQRQIFPSGVHITLASSKPLDFKTEYNLKVNNVCAHSNEPCTQGGLMVLKGPLVRLHQHLFM